MQIKVDKDNRIIAYAKIGDLKGSIEVEDFEFTEDITDYIYHRKKIKYNPNIEKMKKKKRQELKNIREKKISENIEVKGSVFQVREQDLQNFYNLKIAVDLEPARATTKMDWVLADNSIKEFTYSELMEVLGSYILRKSEIFAKFGALSVQLEACNTVEEIESIKWE